MLCCRVVCVTPPPSTRYVPAVTTTALQGVLTSTQVLTTDFLPLTARLVEEGHAELRTIEV